MAKLPDVTKLSPKDQRALEELLSKAGTSLTALSGKSPLSDPAYRKKCFDLRPRLETMCMEQGVTLAHCFTISNKPRKQYKHPETGAIWASKGKKPEWLKGHEDKYEVRAN
jgi:hypothetical protein